MTVLGILVSASVALLVVLLVTALIAYILAALDYRRKRLRVERGWAEQQKKMRPKGQG